MTKRELIVKISHKTGYIQNEVTQIVQETLDAIIDEICQGNGIELRDFGVFEVRSRKSRIGRNPKNPTATVLVPESKVVKFRAGKNVKARLNGKKVD